MEMQEQEKQLKEFRKLCYDKKEPVKDLFQRFFEKLRMQQKWIFIQAC